METVLQRSHMRSHSTVIQLNATPAPKKHDYTGIDPKKPKARDRDLDSLSESELACIRSLYQSDYTQHKARNPKRVTGTCEWFLEHPKYTHWVENKNSDLLWVSADAGCGKSVLASFLIDHLSSGIKKEDTTLCYFFFKDDNSEQRTSAAAFSALLHQIIADDLGLLTHVLPQYQLKAQQFSREFMSLWSVLNVITSDSTRGRSVVCILDGLDECEEQDRIQLIKELSKPYTTWPNEPTESKYSLKFLITSRPGMKLEDILFDLPNIRLRAEDETLAISRDVELVVRETILQIGRRRSIPQAQQEELMKQILAKSDRTFLWVNLVLQRIETSGRFTRQALKELVETSPPDLDGVYEKILRESTNDQYTRKLLKIVVGAFRPLSLTEVNTALCIDPRNTTESDMDLEPRIEATIQVLCGVFLRINDFTLYLAHQTAREFLLRPSRASSPEQQIPGIWKHSFEPDEVHYHLAKVCNYYLHFDEFEKTPFIGDHNIGDAFKKKAADDYANKFSFLYYATRYWADHFRKTSISEDAANLEAFLWLYDINSNRFKTWYTMFWVQVYEYSFGTVQTMPIVVASYFGHTAVVRNMIKKGSSRMSFLKGLFAKPDEMLINQTDNEQMSALTEASRHGHLDVVKLLLKQPGIDVNHRDKMRKTPFLRACEVGNLDIVKLFLARRDVDINACDDRCQSCLSWACGSGNVDIVRLLLSRPGIDINRKNVHEGNAMNFAVGSGSLEIVEILLNLKDPPLEINYNHPTESPITLAAKLGHTRIFDRLARNAEASIGGFNIQAAMYAAISEGREAIFKALLKRDPKLLHSKDSDGFTPFATACKEGRPNIARLLLAEPNVEINSIDSYNAMPIHWAINSRGGTPEIISMLLERDNIILNHKDNNGETPLVAASGGHPDIVKLLLSCKRHRHQIDINSSNRVGFTSLACAAERGQPEVMSMLLAEEGIDLNVQDQWGKTALIWAAYMGQLKCVELLLQAGADYQIVDRDRKTALQGAIARDQKYVITCIVKWELRQGGYDVDNLSAEQTSQLRSVFEGLSAQAMENIGLKEFLRELNLFI
ncbi:ankyrin repeat-containing domain protein [Talaromyces proteolyticus]|uniref:Ankyrin repeat-containing domain protein n=1 Tax=Talaromyces proteolyticus TaxID=1131652 RepID=A0AAD4PWY2_9EURO|nr:ankyrin repeat-containing domain protein [Talaromyces proteolyticus]KAH8698697.1 ankyrin repeat-containing domain protein [Talaromyces proteolyticus]